jgi:hypothetical protein
MALMRASSRAIPEISIEIFLCSKISGKKNATNGI